MTTRAIVRCPHLGLGTSIPSSPKWNIEGGFALREGDSGVLSCIFVPPCVGYTLRSMGLNATRIDGARAILATDFNQTFTGLPLEIIETHSTIDNSRPAAIPVGQAPPPLAPELLDAVPPVVTAATPALAFVIASNSPATNAASFTIASPFPLRWILTRVTEPPNASHADLTGGVPPHAVVSPLQGGAWTTPTLTVTLTMDAVFMAGLGPGRHHFYLAAVSRRGLSAWKETVLTVS